MPRQKRPRIQGQTKEQIGGFPSIITERQKRTRIQGQIKSAAKATEVAVIFLRRYYSFIRPVKATKDDHTWVVEVDVGALRERIAKIHIDVETGSIVKYDVPKLEATSQKLE